MSKFILFNLNWQIWLVTSILFNLVDILRYTLSWGSCILCFCFLGSFRMFSCPYVPYSIMGTAFTHASWFGQQLDLCFPIPKWPLFCWHFAVDHSWRLGPQTGSLCKNAGHVDCLPEKLALPGADLQYTWYSKVHTSFACLVVRLAVTGAYLLPDRPVPRACCSVVSIASCRRTYGCLKSTKPVHTLPTICLTNCLIVSRVLYQRHVRIIRHCAPYFPWYFAACTLLNCHSGCWIRGIWLCCTQHLACTELVLPELHGQDEPNIKWLEGKVLYSVQ